MAHNPDIDATLRTIVLGAFIDKMPSAAYPYLEQAALEAVQALYCPSIHWAIIEMAKEISNAQP